MIICCANINKNKLTGIFPGDFQVKKKDMFHGAASNSYWCNAEKNSVITASIKSLEEQLKLLL